MPGRNATPAGRLMVAPAAGVIAAARWLVAQPLSHLMHHAINIATATVVVASSMARSSRRLQVEDVRISTNTAPTTAMGSIDINISRIQPIAPAVISVMTTEMATRRAGQYRSPTAPESH